MLLLIFFSKKTIVDKGHNFEGKCEETSRFTNFSFANTSVSLFQKWQKKILNSGSSEEEELAVLRGRHAVGAKKDNDDRKKVKKRTGNSARRRL